MQIEDDKLFGSLSAWVAMGKTIAISFLIGALFGALLVIYNV